MLRYISILLLALIINSCTEKEVIIPPFELPKGNKVVLIGDLTGVRCPNCPTGTAKLKSLETLYEGRLVIVGIHGDFLTFPLDESKYDFRNEYSKKLEIALKPWGGKPAAGIDRTEFESDAFAISGIESWQGYIETQFDKEIDIDLALEVTYNSGNRLINLTTTTTTQKSGLSDNYNISVLLIESEIEDAQKGPTSLIEDYVHSDVLRTMLTSAEGDPIAIANTSFANATKTFEYTLPAEDGTWRAEHMDIVAFITNTQTKEVVQTRKISLVE